MQRYSKEFFVGCLVILVVGLLVVFAWLMGAIGPFVHETRYRLLYAFAGGIEVGSPVRVSGVKVGKVERIEFLSQPGTGGDPAVLRVTISVARVASPAVRQDSKFYVNMAGIIGERYIEISPGSSSAPVLAGGSTVRGVDPPRIDQLLSQGYGVFGQVQDFLERNRQTMEEFLDNLNSVLTDANKILRGPDKHRVMALLDNLNGLTIELKGLADTLHDERAKKFFEEITEIVHRGSQVDKESLKKFFQQEGIRAHLF